MERSPLKKIADAELPVADKAPAGVPAIYIGKAAVAAGLKLDGIVSASQGYDKNAVLWYRTKITVPEKQKNLALFFCEVDGKAEVYVNGEKIAVPEKYQGAKKPGATITPGTKPIREGLAKPRTPFEVDVSAAIKSGENTIAVPVDHSQITDLSLGGILRPVLLVAKPE